MLLETGGDGVKFQPRPIAGVKLDEPVEPDDTTGLEMFGNYRMPCFKRQVSLGQNASIISNKSLISSSSKIPSTPSTRLWTAYHS